MRIFITGGTGFIGVPLCRALAGHELMVLSRKPSDPNHSPWRTVQGDLLNPQNLNGLLASFKPEVCIHLAWSGLPDYSMANNALNFEAGITLFQNLLSIQCERIVVAGTCFEYGDLQGCVSENQTPANHSLFAAFKAAQRLIGQSVFHGVGTPFLWARPFFVYGPNQRDTSLIPLVVRSLTEGKSPSIRTPDQMQDFVHVDDVAKMLAMLATSRMPSGTYNVGTGQPVMVRDLVNLVARLLGRPTIYPPAGVQGSGFWANMDWIRACIPDFKPKSIEQGVEETLVYLRRSVKRAA